jgi:DNA-binding FrmR family transcriptional regulator
MNDDVLNRLKTVEGHIRGIERMVEDDAYCIDIIKQIQAVQAALGRVSNLVLDGHLNSCVITAVRGEDLAERERVLSELSEIFLATRKG